MGRLIGIRSIYNVMPCSTLAKAGLSKNLNEEGAKIDAELTRQVEVRRIDEEHLKIRCFGISLP